MYRTDPTTGNGLPTFARPLSSHTVAPAAASKPGFSPLMPTLSLVTVSCAALFLFARTNGAQNLPAGKAGHKTAVTSAKSTVSNTATIVADRESLDFYTNNVRNGMFSAPQPPKAKPPVALPPPPKFVPVPVILPVIDPFADWSYTGTVHMGDITMALLENRQTREGQYVKSGDRFMGAQVQSITDQMVTLTNAGKPSMLAKSDTIIVTPLNQDAPGKNPQANGQVQNGQMPNGQAAAMLSMPTDGSQPSFTLPNGKVLSGDRAARYQQRLDQNFSGSNRSGGNRGGGGNGGGGGRRRGGGGNNNGGGNGG